MSDPTGRSSLTWPMESLSILLQVFLPSSLPVTPPGLGLNSDLAQVCTHDSWVFSSGQAAAQLQRLSSLHTSSCLLPNPSSEDKLSKRLQVGCECQLKDLPIWKE